VRIYGKSLRYRKAVGSIIGGTFILLILLSGYAFYVFSNRAINAHQQVLSNMREYDIDRSQEDLFRDYPILIAPDNNTLRIDIRNNGPKTINIMSIGILDKTVNPFKQIFNSSYNIYLASGDRASVFVYNIDGYRWETVPSSYIIQFVTSRGNVFDSEYPYTLPGYTIADLSLEIISRAIGYFVPKYNSFEYAIYNASNTYTYDKWQPAWEIPKGKALIFRLNFTYYGKNEFTIGKYTEIAFNRIGVAANTECFMFNNTGVYNHEQFTTYSGSKYQKVTAKYENLTIYFGLIGYSLSPPLRLNDIRSYQEGRYSLVLGIFNSDRTYAQGIPFIAVDVN